MDRLIDPSKASAHTRGLQACCCAEKRKCNRCWSRFEDFTGSTVKPRRYSTVGRKLTSRSVLLLVNYRPEYQHPGQQDLLHATAPRSFAPESAEELLHTLLGD